MNIEEWITKITKGESQRGIAATIGWPPATVSRQFKHTISPELVVAIARAYKASPLNGLVKLGLLNDLEVKSGDFAAAIEAVDDEVLVAEILRRLQDDGDEQHEGLVTPISPNTGDDTQAVSEPHGGLRVAFDSNPHEEQDEGSDGR